LEKFVEDDPFYEYETCFLCDPENPNDCFETSLIHTLLISNILFEEEKLPLKEGTYTRTYEVLYTTHTYTITLHQDEPPASQVILQKNRGNQKTEIERAEQAKSDFELYLNRRSRD